MNFDFEKYLQTLGISAKSIKNYRSDISQFFSWAKETLKSVGAYVNDLTEVSPFITSEFVNQYLEFMKKTKLPRKTVNRRLSTLRHLSRFLTSQAVIGSDFMNGIQNIPEFESVRVGNFASHPSVSEFQTHLEAEKISKNTVKNYMSDVRQFLIWLEKNHAQLT